MINNSIIKMRRVPKYAAHRVISVDHANGRRDGQPVRNRRLKPARIIYIVDYSTVYYNKYIGCQLL